MAKNSAKVIAVFSAFIIMAAVIVKTPAVFADAVSDLKDQISAKQTAINELENQIAATQKQIDASQGKQKTLSGAISILDAERKQLLAQITVTEQKISAKELEIQSLSLSIGDKNDSIQKSYAGLAETIRNINSTESEPLIMYVLNDGSLADIWNSIAQGAALNSALDGHISELKNLKTELEQNKATAETARHDLKNLESELSARKKIADDNKADKQKLLSATKNQESTYQKMLKDQLAKKNAFEQELLQYESQLNFAVDSNKLPQTGSGVLHWPLDSVFITQYFGNTDFATKNPQVYSGMGHNGIDLRAAIGTPIKAALSGVVKGLGNTDTVCAGASYGKWVLIEHGNGLSTIYAHLSAFNISTGDLVTTGQVIGYTGITGYTTGPHLHFGVYATQGVKIMSRASQACNGGVYTMPIASLNAYLNPLSYLPSYSR